ncbi:hypothetical protein [Actinoallomurus oryzae]|uniref:hypothetical protein n=1 Tax=Actinoallomurus oryzae TaxID=502180 RepID=UPI0031F0D461
MRLWGDDREREMRLVVGSAFVIHQPAESFSGPGRAKEDLEFTAAGGLTAGNRGVHDLDRQILLRNSISAGHPLAYDGTRPWRPGVQSDGRQLSVEAVRPAGRTDGKTMTEPCAKRQCRAMSATTRAGVPPGMISASSSKALNDRVKSMTRRMRRMSASSSAASSAPLDSAAARRSPNSCMAFSPSYWSRT